MFFIENMLIKYVICTFFFIFTSKIKQIFINQTFIMMKKIFTLFAFSFMLFASVNAQEVAGNYEREKDFMSNPTVLMLKADGHFELVTGATSIVGTYTFSAGSLVFTDERGNYADITAGNGVYQVTNTDKGIRFKAVKDKAIQRKDVLIGSDWKKVGKLEGN